MTNVALLSPLQTVTASLFEECILRERQCFIALILCFPVGTFYELPEAKTLKEDGIVTGWDV